MAGNQKKAVPKTKKVVVKPAQEQRQGQGQEKEEENAVVAKKESPVVATTEIDEDTKVAIAAAAKVNKAEKGKEDVPAAASVKFADVNPFAKKKDKAAAAATAAAPAPTKAVAAVEDRPVATKAAAPAPAPVPVPAAATKTEKKAAISASSSSSAPSPLDAVASIIRDLESTGSSSSSSSSGGMSIDPARILEEEARLKAMRVTDYRMRGAGTVIGGATFGLVLGSALAVQQYDAIGSDVASTAAVMSGLAALFGGSYSVTLLLLFLPPFLPSFHVCNVSLLIDLLLPACIL